MIEATIGKLSSRIDALERKLNDLASKESPGGYTVGSILFAGSAGGITQDNSNLYWDDTNNRLGIGTTVPSGSLHVKFTGGSKIGLEIEDNSASGDTLIKLINPTNEIASGSYFIRAIKGTTDQFYVRGDGVGYFSSTLTADGDVTTNAVNRFIQEDAGTNNQVTPLSLYHRSTGTPTTNFGVNFNLFLDSATVADRNAGTVQALWVTATDASRLSQMRFYAYDATTFREFFRGGTSGSAPQISFFGGTANAKQTVTGSRGGNAALASLLTALANYGLITDSSTA